MRDKRVRDSESQLYNAELIYKQDIFSRDIHYFILSFSFNKGNFKHTQLNICFNNTFLPNEINYLLPTIWQECTESLQ